MDVALAFMTDGCYEGCWVDIYISQKKKLRIKKKTQKRDLGGPGNLIKSHPMRSLATMSESGNLMTPHPMYWQNELETL